MSTRTATPLRLVLICAAAIGSGFDTHAQKEGAAGAWPHWRGAGFNATVTNDRPLFRDPFTLRVRWRRTLGPGYSGIVVSDGRAVTMFSDGRDDVLVSLDADTGGEQWRLPLAPTFPGRDGSAGGPVSTPVLEDGMVFALGPRGELVAVRASDGRQIWKRHLVRDFGAVEPHWGFTTSPLVAGERLIVFTGGGDGHAVTALDKRTGDVAWRSASDDASYQSPMLARIHGVDQLVVGGEKFLFALDPLDGRQLWKYEHAGAGFYAKIINPVSVGEGNLLLTNKPDQSVLISTAPPGREPSVAWTTRELKLNYGTPVVQGDRIFGYSSAFLTCVNATTGALLWRSRAPGDGFPLLVDGHLVILTKQGELSVSVANDSGYSPKASLELFSRLVWTPPSFAGGRIFARDSYAEIAAVDVVPASSMTEAAPVRPVAGKVPGSAFAKWIDETTGTPDAAARVARFLDSQKAFPVIEGERYVHFLYDGGGREPLLRSDLLGTGVDLPMHHLPGTGLYYASLETEPDARFGYQFVRNMGEVVADARNPRKATSQNFAGDVSIVLMPKADKRLPAPASLRGRIVDLEFDSGSATAQHLRWGGKREVHVYLPPGYDVATARRYPAVYVLYGNEMLRDGHLAAALEAENTSAVIVFVASTNGYEYARTFRDAHARMLAERLVPWVDGQFRTLPDAGARVLIGADEGGYAATEIGLRYPRVFGNVAAQSIFPLSSGDEELLALIERSSNKGQRFSIDWGRYDPRRPTDRLDVAAFSARVRERLAARGYAIRGEGWNDGSVILFWAARASLGIRALLSPR